MSEKHKVVEAYYSPARLAVLLDYSDQWVRNKIKAGEFGNECVLVNADYRVPASAVNAFLSRHNVRLAEPILARTPEELKRKMLPNV